MKCFNFDDGILELDSVLLCNISVPPMGTQYGTAPTGDSTIDQTAKNSGVSAGDSIPDVGDAKDSKEPGKTTLKEPGTQITDKNAQDILSAMADAEKTVVSITELLQAIIKMNRERKDMEVKMMWAECQNIVNNIQTQADNIRSDALKSFIINLCVSGLSIGAGTMSTISASKSLSKINAAADAFNAGGEKAVQNLDIALKNVDQNSKFWGGLAEITKGVGQFANAFNEYFSKRTEAGNKELDAQTEVFRTVMEEVKKNLDDARSAITSCQSNISELLQTNRQTLNKVMG